MRRVILSLFIAALTVPAMTPGLAGASNPLPHRQALLAKKAPSHCKKPINANLHPTSCKKRKSGPATPTALPTFTPTPTATATPTPTSTLPSSPTIGSLPVRADLAIGYRAAFYVCGLPPGTAAVFSPNPATSSPDSTSPIGAAHSVLHVAADEPAAPGTYSLALHAYFQDPRGQQVFPPPGGGKLEPGGVTLTIDGQDNTSLSPLSPAPAVGLTGCSDIPPGFGPSPTPTPSSSAVQVFASVSNTHPAAGQTVSVTGIIRVNGQPVASVVIHTHWYFPDHVGSCDAVTQSNGVGSCFLVMTPEIPNQTVAVQVIFLYNGQQYTTYAYLMT